MDHIVISPGRITALGKYLAALVGSFRKQANDISATKDKKRREKPSFNRKQIHVLYLLNDALHHTKEHRGADFMLFLSLTSTILPQLVPIVKHTASCDRTKHVNHFKRLEELVDLWATNKYYKDEEIAKLRKAVEDGGTLNDGTSRADGTDGAGLVNGEPAKDPPYTLPATHGDTATPWFDLPAANLLPHIRSRRVPIKPWAIKPIQLAAGPAKESLSNAVKEFLKDVSFIDQDSNFAAVSCGRVRQFDELGQPLVRDNANRKFVAKENYYGWSIPFANKMRTLRREGASAGNEDVLRRRRNYSDDSRSDQESSPRKRARRSFSSTNSNGSRSHSRSPSGFSHGRSNRRPGGMEFQPLNRRRGRSSRSRSNSRPDSRDNNFTPRSQQHPPQHISYPPPPPMDAAHPGSMAGRPSPQFITPTGQINPPFPAMMPPPPSQPPTGAFRHGDNGMPGPPPWHGNARWPPMMPSWQQGPMPPPPAPVAPYSGRGNHNGRRGGHGRGGGGYGGGYGESHAGSYGGGAPPSPWRPPRQGWNQSGYRGRGGPAW